MKNKLFRMTRLGVRGRAIRQPGLTLALVVTLLLGVAASAGLFQLLARLEDERLTNHLNQAARTLARYADEPDLEELLYASVDRLTAVRTALDEEPRLSRERLESFLWDEPPEGLDNPALEYLPRRIPDEEDITGIEISGENQGYPVVEQGEGGLRTVTPREEYYPVALEASSIDDQAPVGLDRAAGELQWVAMQEARDTGMVSTFSSYPLMSTDQEYMVAHYYLPLYTPGSDPQNIEARRKEHTGFISLVTYTSVNELLPFLPETILGVDAANFLLLGPAEQQDWDSEIERRLEEGEMANTVFTSRDNTVSLLAEANDELREGIYTSRPYWALAGGLLFTLLVCVLLVRARRHSQHIAALVEERTRDLAEQTRRLKESNEALQESESRYRMLANNVSDVIYTLNPDGICQYISPSVRQQSGYGVHDYLEQPVFRYLNPRDRKRAIRLLGWVGKALERGRIAAGSYRTFIFEGSTRDGKLCVLETKISPLLDEMGDIDGFLGVARDITARRKAEREHQQLEEAYRQSQKMEAIGTLAGGVAHDFNNLLTALLGHTELLTEQLADRPQALQSLQVIEKAAKRAQDLTGQLLGFARKGRFQSVPVNLDSVLDDVASFTRRTMNKNIEINHERAADEPLVLGDPVQLGQVFLNLAINAREAMADQKGRIEFVTSIRDLDAATARAVPDLQPGRYCVVTVSDTGKGIPQERLTRIFEPFYTNKPDGEGTGMGLAMVYGVVHSHGGTLTVDSQEGQGTTFTLYFPASEVNVAEADETEEMPPVEGGGRILLVDDEELVCGLLRQMLERLGYQVDEVADGDEAIAYYHKHGAAIDLVVLDLIMPGMGGLECLKELKKQDAGVRVILTSGYGREDLAETFRDEHIVGFLQKPYRLQALSEVIAEAVSTDLKAPADPCGR